MRSFYNSIANNGIDLTSKANFSLILLEYLVKNYSTRLKSERAFSNWRLILEVKPRLYLRNDAADEAVLLL